MCSTTRPGNQRNYIPRGVYFRMSCARAFAEHHERGHEYGARCTGESVSDIVMFSDSSTKAKGVNTRAEGDMQGIEEVSRAEEAN